MFGRLRGRTRRGDQSGYSVSAGDGFVGAIPTSRPIVDYAGKSGRAVGFAPTSTVGFGGWMSTEQSNFDQITLGEAVTFQRGFDITKNEQTAGNIPIVSSSGVSSFHNQSKTKGPGVVIGRKGTLGTVHYLKDAFWPHDTTLWVKDFKGNNPRFIYYFLKPLHLENFDSGSSNPTLNRNHIHKIKVVFPKPHIQQKIAAILSAYDDLIENNKRRIALLEKMAEEIYREWFVRLRFPGHDKVKVVKGVPEGWEEKRFGEICKFEKGKNPAELLDFPVEGALPYINVETLEKNGNSYAMKSKNSVVCHDDDILMLMDGARSGVVFRGCKGVVGSTFSLIKMDTTLKHIIFEYLKACKESIIFNNTGSAIPHANKEFINRMSVFIPNDSDLVDRFNQIYQGIFDQKRNLELKNTGLNEMKNMLSPRLISGKLSAENLDIQFPPGMGGNILSEP